MLIMADAEFVSMCWDGVKGGNPPLEWLRIGVSDVRDGHVQTKAVLPPVEQLWDDMVKLGLRKSRWGKVG